MVGTTLIFIRLVKALCEPLNSKVSRGVGKKLEKVENEPFGVPNIISSLLRSLGLSNLYLYMT